MTLGYEIIYFRRKMAPCDVAKEDFSKKRQQSEMFFFLFLFSLVYLNGVPHSISMAVRDDVTLSSNATVNVMDPANFALSLTSGWNDNYYSSGSCYVDGNCFATG